MKKKVLIFVLVVILLACSVPAVQGIAAMIENARIMNDPLLKAAIETENTVREDISTDIAIGRTDKWDNQRLEDFLASNGYYVDDINIAIGKYIDASIMYDMTDAENEYIMALAKEGYDFEKLIDLYTFTKNTDSGIKLIRQIYDKGAPEAGLEFWIEDTYERLTYGESAALQMEDIMGYVNKGLEVDDILMTFQLSIKGNMSARKILDNKLSGLEWNEIVAKIYADDGVIPETFIGLESLREINEILYIARRTNKSIIDAVEVIDGKTVLKAEIMEDIDKKYEQVEEAKKIANIKDAGDIIFIAAAKEKLSQMDEDQIEEAILQGKRIKDIEKQANEDAKLLTEYEEELTKRNKEIQDTIYEGGEDL